MTAQIEIKKEVKEYANINLPHYRKSTMFFFKVVNQDQCICVETGKEVGIKHAGLAWHLESSQDCSEAEFNRALRDTLETLESVAYGEQEDETDMEDNEKDPSDMAQRAQDRFEYTRGLGEGGY